MKEEKTNVVRLLEAKKITFRLYHYPHSDQALDGEMVAKLINKDPKQVFKTLVARAKHQVYVFMIPVFDSLDLKKASFVVNEKSLELVGVNELLPLTGYVRGGCSPIGMRYKYPTYIDEKVKDYILDLVFATRTPQDYKLEDLKPLISYGASPRASIMLTLAAKANAFLQGRGYVTPDDVKQIGTDVLRHRVLVTYEAEAEDITSDDIVKKIFDQVEVP